MLIFPESVLDQHLVVLGKTGAGKSSALRYIVEHLLRRKKRVCVIDPKGDWNGLKVAADGHSPGFPVILFGDFKETAGKPIHADVPLNEYSGKHVAELVTSGNRPCVVGFRGWTQGEMHRFWIDFASTLFNSNEGEFYLVIDEVHNFAPKGKILSPEVGKCLHWANRVMNEGRGIGLVNLIASQRPQKVHNDTLTACETLVAMRVIHKADRDAVEDWIKGCGDPKQGAEVLNALAGMKRGEAYVWSPEVEFGPERLTFPMFTTFDSFAPPQLQKKVRGKDWASVDLEAVKEKLAAVIEKAKAEDPRELNKIISEKQKEIAALKNSAEPREQDTKRIAELEEQLRNAPKAAKSTELKRLRVAMETAMKFLIRIEAEGFSKEAGVDEATVKAAIEAAISQVTKDIERKANERDEALEKLRKEAGRIIGRLKALERGEEVEIDVQVTHQQPFAVSRAPVAPARPSQQVVSSNGEITGVMQKILNALAEFEAIGVERVPRVQAAFMAGYSNLASKSFANAMGSLRSGGYISYPDSDSLSFTAVGRSLASPVEAPLTTEELQRRIVTLLGGVHGKVVEQLITLYPDHVDKANLAQMCGYTNVASKSFANAVGRLRTLGFVDYPEPGKVIASPVLFLRGG